LVEGFKAILEVFMKFNFELLKNEFIDDISSEGFIYKHRSGAKLVYIKNNDNNRVFSATFKTLPENNKGIAHIMEHSVLCGSRRYPVKDPFNELSKGSLNTYLNAMTFVDKTMYPIASTNEKDFVNLMRVYLDAVFFPLIYERKGVFLQEGWHFEKEKINGVVYNEMKGVFSSPDRIMDFKLTEKLFCDTKYKFYSGGVPEFIPDLTYDEFIDFHKKYYHPANCILYLYGDLNIDDFLEFIDRDYLSEFDFKEINTEYLVQKDFSSLKTAEFQYQALKNDDKDSNYFECGAIIGKAIDFKLSFVFDILTDILLGTEGSPLKKALIQNGIGDNVLGWFDDDLFQTTFSVSIEKTKCDDLDKFKKVYFDTLNAVVEKGLDKKLVESCINRYRFYFKEEDYGYRPKGLFYNIALIKSFIYGDGSFDCVKFNELLEYAESVSFEEIIKKYLIENKNYVFAVMRAAAEKAEVNNNSYESDDDFDKYKKLEDLEEDIKKIPVLNIEDIDKKERNIDIFEEYLCGRKLIHSKIENDDIVYLNLLFDTRSLDLKDLKYISVLKYILGKTDTKNYSYEQLANEINFYFGEFKADFEIYGKEDFLPFLSLNMKFLSKNISNVFSVLREVVFYSVFDKKRIKELLFEYKILLEKSFIKNGHIYAAARCMSYISDWNKYSQNVTGLEFYRFLRGLLEDFNNKADVFQTEFENAVRVLFNKNALTIGLVCGENNYKKIYRELESICNEFDNFEFQKKNILFENCRKNEAFIINSQVQYNVIASDYKKFGFDFNGKFLAVEKIVSSDYLWNRIRVEGGAYGGGCSFLRRGLLYMFSYRDPNVLKTFEAYKNIPSYIKNLDLSDRELKKFIIGTINVLDRPLKISQVMEKILKRNLSQISDDQRQKERDDILSVKKSDIYEFSDILEKSLAESGVCSFGNERALKNDAECFDFIEETALF